MVNSDKKRGVGPSRSERRAASSKESGGGLGTGGDTKARVYAEWPVVFLRNRSEGWGLENRRTLGMGVQGEGKAKVELEPQATPTF